MPTINTKIHIYRKNNNNAFFNIKTIITFKPILFYMASSQVSAVEIRE